MKEKQITGYIVMGLFSALGSYLFYKIKDKTKNQGGII